MNPRSNPNTSPGVRDGQGPARIELSDYVEITNLIADAAVAAEPDGRLKVLARKKDPTVSQVWCRIGDDSGVAIPAPTTDPPSADYTRMDVDSDWFSVNMVVPNIPLADPATGLGAVPYVRVAVFPRIGNTGVVWQTSDVVRCKPYRPTTGSVVKVDARQSLWFAYADPGYPQRPRWREVGDTYRPLAIPIPPTAVSVAFEANRSQLWGHFPGDRSQANGIGSPVALDPAYQTEYKTGLNSENITGTLAKLDSLVAMFGGNSAWTGDNRNVEMVIGFDTSPISIPASRPTVLYLGMHDGYQWTNNNGTIDVQITWGI